MKAPLLLHLLFQGVLLYDALGWEVRMPKDMHGLQGSCLVIPCSFSYTSYPPENPHRVVWYQYASSGYPLVFDPLHPNDVIEKFRGKTDSYRSSSRDCSLLIKNLEPSHHGEKIYAWIDPENVGWRTYEFYEVTSTILVKTSPQQPSIKIYGGERMDDTITVACSTFHTCPYSKPNITLNGIKGSDQIDNEPIKDGLWKITLTRTGVVKAEHSTIQCLVTHYGGITVTATKDKSAECVHHNITIEPELADVTFQAYFNFSALFHNEADTVLTGLKTIGLYILTPSFVFLLACILAGVIIYKKRQRSKGASTESGKKPFSKPRMPSPKSDPKSHSGYDYEADYINMDEGNVYGNI